MLETYGLTQEGYTALGRFLSILKDFVDKEDTKFIDNIINRYSLMSADSTQIIRILFLPANSRINMTYQI